MEYQSVGGDEAAERGEEVEGGLWRGPCAPILNRIDSMAEEAQRQSLYKSAAMILAGMFVVLLVNGAIQDEEVTVLSKGRGVCAGEVDLLEKATGRCRVENKLALGYMRGASWVKCADFTQGDGIVRAGADGFGNYWYGIADMRKVNFFYTSCTPTCASQGDVWDLNVQGCEKGSCQNGMCAAKDAVASEWYRTNEEKKKNLFFMFFPDKGGNLCIETPRSMPGIDAMRRGTAAVVKSGANVGKQLYYYPEDARAVSNFYGGCVGECACTDRLVRTKDGSSVCHIADEGVRIFFFPIPGSPGDVMRGGESVNTENADCRATSRQIATLRSKGQLRGDYREASYLPTVSATMKQIYLACARHVSCPGN